MHPKVSKARAVLASNSRRRCDNPDKRAEARRALEEANREAYVEKLLAEAPKLTDSQRASLAELLRPARGGDPVVTT